MWPRVDGMRSLELGAPGELREELNALVLSGAKTTTTGLLEDYVQESEGLEFVGERLAVLDDDGRSIATVEITAVEVTDFAEVTWEHADGEGEGFTTLADWRAAHHRYWDDLGAAVRDDTRVVCLTFRLV
ncbi:ASCH domain-containing protein [Streptomyces sp. CC224B]|uniref:ASCH domain-containing protein n=1 Tax=Streptomyces sp. CC224B TaxID=3044571 RepID=UPI0024A88C46|nr:ASCH domain-containing protein [Streptomyces sp. CC224B]